MIGVELFSGAGGMSLGATMAGVKVKMAIEIDAAAAKTFNYNHKGAVVINDDIRNVKSINITPAKGEQKVLFGGPPCQGYSRSNKRTRTKQNPNNWLFEEFARIAKLWRPDWIILENVEGVLGTEKGLFLDQIYTKFSRLGYSINYKILNALHYGVPQRRERLFVVGSLHGAQFYFPEPSIKKVITTGEALEDLPILENGHNISEMKYKFLAKAGFSKRMRGSLKVVKNNLVSKNADYVIERYKHIPEGGNWQNIPLNLMDTYFDASRCHSGIYHRLDSNKPSVVIGNYRKSMLIHPWENRGLSVREAARLQSFPDWFEFSGMLGDQQQQVGNAVPPLLAEAIFGKLKKDH